MREYYVNLRLVSIAFVNNDYHNLYFGKKTAGLSISELFVPVFNIICPAFQKYLSRISVVIVATFWSFLSTPKLCCEYFGP